jgi:hypothetical protein
MSRSAWQPTSQEKSQRPGDSGMRCSQHGKEKKLSKENTVLSKAAL